MERDREQGRAIWEDYVALADGRRRTVAPGDKLPFRRIEFSFVASHGAFVETLEPRLPNRLCETAVAGPTPAYQGVAVEERTNHQCGEYKGAEGQQKYGPDYCFINHL